MKLEARVYFAADKMEFAFLVRREINLAALFFGIILLVATLFISPCKSFSFSLVSSTFFSPISANRFFFVDLICVLNFLFLDPLFFACLALFKACG